MKAEIRDLKEDINKLELHISALKSKMTLLLFLNFINILVEIGLIIAELMSAGYATSAGHAIAQQGVQQGAQAVIVKTR